LPQRQESRSYSYADWESACHFENLARRDPVALRDALANIDPTVSAFQNAIAMTDAALHASVVDDLTSAVDACSELQNALDQKCGRDGPSLYEFLDVLNAIRQLMSQSLHTRQEVDPVAEYPAGAEGGTAEIEVWASSPIRNRSDAYRRLSEAADYLLRTEPHSPTPYLVKRAVEWGDLKLPDLLKEIVRNQGEMNEIDRLLRLSGKGLGDGN